MPLTYRLRVVFLLVLVVALTLATWRMSQPTHGAPPPATMPARAPAAPSAPAVPAAPAPVVEEAVVPPRPTVVRFYDIRPLLAIIPDFYPLMEFEISVGLQQPSEPPMPNRWLSNGGLVPAWFGPGFDEVPLTKKETMDSIKTILQDTIATARWNDLSSMTDFNGFLMIRTPVEEHAEIAALLEKLKSTRMPYISVEIHFYRVKTALVESAIAGPGHGTLVLDEKAAGQFLDHLAADKSEALLLGIARNVSASGQVVPIVALHQTPMQLDQAPADTSSPAPQRSAAATQPASMTDGPRFYNFMQGHTTQYSATYDSQDKSIAITLQASQLVTGDVRKFALPGGRRGADASASGKSAAAPGAASAGEMEAPEVDYIDFKTNVRIPAGGAVILAGTAAAGVKDLDMEEVLILRAKPVE